MSEHFITPEQLCPGLYIHLELGWMDHPFTFSSFKIKDQEQINILKQLRLQRIKYDPRKSTAQPPTQPAATPAPTPNDAEAADISDVLAKKAASIEQLRTMRTDIEQVEKKFIKAADSIKKINKNLQSNPEAAVQEADATVGQMVETMLSGGDIMLHAIGEKLGEDTYFHSLNVSVLSLMLAKAAELPTELIHQIGLGAILHDIGKTEIPYKVVAKTEPLTKAEQALMEQHCAYGVKMAGRMNLSAGAMSIIAQHHEYVDGTGYPAKLSGDKMTVTAQLVSVVNAYDNLCNPHNLAVALTPSEALAQMYAHKRAKFDDRLLKLFIKRLGIYPPGSLVQLSNEMLGLVVSVNSEHPLKPNVLVYDATIPKENALIVSLESEPDLKVVKSLRPAQLPRQVHQYLNPRKNVTYFFDPKKRDGAS